MATLHDAWKNHPPETKNHTLKFALAWTHLKQAYMDLQETARHEEPLINLLQSRLVQLKMDILYESKPFQNGKSQLVKS